MKSPTHAAFSLCLTSLCLGTANPIALGLAALASQLPDVDTTTSRVGRLLKPLARYLERWPHRTASHSFLGVLVIVLLSSPLGLVGRVYWLSLICGFAFGCLGDMLTKEGVAFLWPFTTKRVVMPGNPDLRLETGSTSELIFLMILMVVLGGSFAINLAGGGMRVFSNLLGLPSGAISIIKEENDQYLLLAKFRGLNNLTQQEIHDECEVVRPLTINDFLIRCEGNILYRIGSSQQSQIQVSRVRVRRKSESRSEVTTLEFNEQPFSLPELTDRIYISGVLRIDDAEELRIIPSPDQFDPLTLQPMSEGMGQVRLESALPGNAGILEGHIATGKIVIRRIYVR